MFKFLGGSGGTKKPSPNVEKKKGASTPPGLVDPSLFVDPMFDDEPELDMPQEGMQKNHNHKTFHVKFILNKKVDVSALMADEAVGDVTDDDMNDPDLLAELNEIAEPGTYNNYLLMIHS